MIDNQTNRYVPSRLSENPASVIGHVPPITTAATGATLMDTLDFELDLLGTNNPGSRIPPYGTLSQPVATKPLPVYEKKIIVLFFFVLIMNDCFSFFHVDRIHDKIRS